MNDLSNSRLRQFGGTSATWGGWSKPLSNLDLVKFGFEPEEIEKYQSQTCEILDIKNSFKESSIDENFNQIEFQFSSVRFYNKYFEHVK